MSDEDITQISLGSIRVGVSGLKAAIEELKSWQGRPEDEIAQELWVRVKPKNYIPAAAQEEYKHAFLREYKRALGEPVREEWTGLNVKVLGSGCAGCDHLVQTIMTVLAELDLPAEVEHVKDVREIAAAGVFGIPAVLINGQVMAVGQTPPAALLKKWLAEAYHQSNHSGETSGPGKN